jgi:hypothetical protein
MTVTAREMTSTAAHTNSSALAAETVAGRVLPPGVATVYDMIFPS